MPRKPAKTERSIQSVARALQIMRLIGNRGNAVPLTTISEGVGLSNSTVHGLLATLRQNPFVAQDAETGKYSLGLALFELGQIVHQSMDIRAVSLPYLRQLSGKYGETVHLACLSKDEIVYIEKVESPRSIRMISQVGSRNPAHCTGVGKVLLAELAADELADFVRTKPLTRFTANTITDPALLKKQLAAIQADGYGLDEEEIEDGLRCVAAPVRNHRGAAMAAISLSVPTNRLNAENLPALIADVKTIAQEISARLGYRD